MRNQFDISVGEALDSEKFDADIFYDNETVVEKIKVSGTFIY